MADKAHKTPRKGKLQVQIKKAHPRKGKLQVQIKVAIFVLRSGTSYGRVGPITATTVGPPRTYYSQDQLSRDKTYELCFTHFKVPIVPEDTHFALSLSLLYSSQFYIQLLLL